MEKTCSIYNDDDIMMPWMGQELKGFAEKGHIIELDEAWFRYRKLCWESGHDIPYIHLYQSFKSRKSFSKINYYMLERRGDHENKTVLVPSRILSIPIAWFLQSDRNTESHINQFKPTIDDFLSPLIHTALKLKGDIHLMIATQVYGCLNKMPCHVYQIPYTCLLKCFMMAKKRYIRTLKIWMSMVAVMKFKIPAFAPQMF